MNAHTLQSRESESASGDLRLVWGFALPLVFALLVIGAFFLVGEMWLLPAMMLVVFGLTAMVTVGFNQLLGDSEETQDDES
jgi:hypothetical protein